MGPVGIGGMPPPVRVGGPEGVMGPVGIGGMPPPVRVGGPEGVMGPVGIGGMPPPVRVGGPAGVMEIGRASWRERGGIGGGEVGAKVMSMVECDRYAD